MKAAQIGDHGLLADATVFLTGSEDTVRMATDAAGYRYVYDPEHDQFAHPAAAFVLTKDGHIARVLSGLGLTGSDLRLALVDAGEGRVGSLLDQIRLRCFGFDAAQGIYTASITRMLAIAGAATVFILIGGILVTTARKRRAVP
jgi:protein SCO1/2